MNEEEKRATPGKVANDRALEHQLRELDRRLADPQERSRLFGAERPDREDRNLLAPDELPPAASNAKENQAKLLRQVRAKLGIVALLALVLLTGCTSLKDALALFASLADKTGEVENWHGVVEQAGIAPGSFAREKSLEDVATTPDILGLETILVKLSSGEIYPVICPATMSIRCQQFPAGTKVFINEGNIVDCNVIRGEVLYGSCIAARQLRQEM